MPDHTTRRHTRVRAARCALPVPCVSRGQRSLSIGGRPGLPKYQHHSPSAVPSDAIDAGAVADGRRCTCLARYSAFLTYNWQLLLSHARTASCGACRQAPWLSGLCDESVQHTQELHAHYYLHPHLHNVVHVTGWYTVGCGVLWGDGGGGCCPRHA